MGSRLLPADSLQEVAGSELLQTIPSPEIGKKAKPDPKGLLRSFGSPAFSDGVGETRGLPSTPREVYGLSETLATSCALVLVLLAGRKLSPAGVGYPVCLARPDSESDAIKWMGTAYLKQ